MHVFRRNFIPSKMYLLHKEKLDFVERKKEIKNTGIMCKIDSDKMCKIQTL